MKVLQELFPHVNLLNVLQHMEDDCTPKYLKRIRQLFQRLRDASETNETEMVRLLYGDSRTSSHPPFQELLTKTSVAAIKAFVLPSARHTSSPSRRAMIQRCERAYALLYMTSERSTETRIKLWRQLVKSARQCHHIPLELECLQVLQAIYGYRSFDETLLEDTETKIRRCFDENSAITRCKMAAMDLRIASTEGTPYPRNIPAEEIISAIRQYDLYDIQYYGGEMLTQLSIHQQDWREALNYSGGALTFFRENFPKERQPLVHFLYNQVLIFTALLDFSQGWSRWKDLLRLCKRGKTSSATQLGKVIEVGIVLALRCGNAKTTSKLLLAIEDGGGVKLIPEREYGRWLTYLRSLALLNNDRPDVLEMIATQERRIQREGKKIVFRREDEQIMAIIECLQLLRGQSFRKAAVIVTTLRDSLPKRLSPDHPEYRLQLFLRLLVESGYANFHRAATLRKTSKILKRLRTTGPGITDDGIDTELIVYEHLWEILLLTLTEKAPRLPYLAN